MVAHGCAPMPAMHRLAVHQQRRLLVLVAEAAVGGGYQNSHAAPGIGDATAVLSVQLMSWLTATAARQWLLHPM